MGGYYDRSKVDVRVVDEVKSKVTIPMYFDKIIIPARSDYYVSVSGDLNTHIRTCCPLHDEDTPSFYYREAYGTYKCFGCGAYGDVINLHQEFTYKETGQRISFESAVKFLKKVFIDGNDLVSRTEAKKVEVIEPNVMAYINSLYVRAYKSIMCNKGIGVDEKKALLWRIMSLRTLAYSNGKKVEEAVIQELRGIR